MRVVYENLGQCVGDRVVYIRSTDIEQMNWHRLLWSIPDEWFYRWSIGDEIVVHDVTSNSSGGKVKRIFVPVVSVVMGILLRSQYPTKRHKMQEHIEAALQAQRDDKALGQRIRFWADKIVDTPLTAEVDIVQKEPNTIYRLAGVE